MERVYFISDVHLGGHDREVEADKVQRLSTFLDHLRDRAQVLYIVGDLHNFWFEYRRAIPKFNLKVVAKLIGLIESGIEIRYFLGNHDQWHDHFWANETGMKVYRQSAEVMHNGLKLYLAHGDGLAAGDLRNRVLKRIFHNRLNRTLFRLIHPDIGIALAQSIASKSAEKGVGGHEEDYRNFAQRKLREGYDAVILGHTHIPLFEQLAEGYYINLGDWIRSFTFLELSGDALRLRHWNGTIAEDVRAETSNS